MAKILIAGCQHLRKPNLPRNSRHTLLSPHKFPLGRYPLERFWAPFGNLATWQPVWQNYDLIHSFNCIPYTNKPWFVTSESHLALYENLTDKIHAQFIEILQKRLALDNCKKIIAISDYAKIRILRQLKNWPNFNKIENKVETIHPNFYVKTTNSKTYQKGEKLNLVFIGNHFARKGGIVALRLAQKAQKINLPITVHIISQLKYGSRVPTDFPDQAQYQKDLELLNLDNVVVHHKLPNSEVLEILSRSHFHILATLQDTYGYSVIESFSVATPVITTNICALPEFVHPGKNGYLLNLDLNEFREWNNPIPNERRNTNEYWDFLTNTYDNLANQLLQILQGFFDKLDQQEHYEQLSSGALERAKNVHDAEKVNSLFDDFYSLSIGKAA